MTFTLLIETGNAAFEPFVEGELARILRALADQIEAGPLGHRFQPVFDLNGNEVGSVALRQTGLHPVADGGVFDQDVQ